MTINKPIALYIHIPFCVSRCEYCDFVSNTCIDRIDDYITALTSEITRNVDKFKDRKVSSVYFGGGTPSLISSEQFLRVFSAVKLYNIADNAEITVECNPESVTKEKLDTYKHCGVNRVSVGVQSCIDTQLKTIGRAHSYEDVTRALDLIFDSGFSNVSCDIMLGLPDETRKTVEITLDKIFAYPLTHLSAYSLILEKGTKLYNRVNDRDVTLPEEDETVDNYDFVCEYLEKKGLFRYEVSNFAKLGYESRHNKVYWNDCEYIGFGESAHSFVRDTRFSNCISLDEYITSISLGKSAIVDKQKLSTADRRFEFVMLGLRKSDGISLLEFKKLFKTDFYTVFFNAHNLQEQGFLIEEGDRLFVAPTKIYVLNSILVELMN